MNRLYFVMAPLYAIKMKSQYSAINEDLLLQERDSD